jgi:Lamin Tail Domain
MHTHSGFSSPSSRAKGSTSNADRRSRWLLLAKPALGAALAVGVMTAGQALAATSIFITEIAPWSSGNSPVGADWFELTNTGASPVNITGWKFDDNSNNFASSVALNAITSIGAGESVIFIEGATVNSTFSSNWFGTNPPASLQVGNYYGRSVGISAAGDAVNIFDSSGALQAKVVFGTSPAGPFTTFDNAALLDNVTISTLSAVGVNGAFIAVNSSQEIGSPGTIGASTTPAVPGPLPLLGASAAFVYSRRLRARLRAKSSSPLA